MRGVVRVAPRHCGAERVARAAHAGVELRAAHAAARPAAHADTASAHARDRSVLLISIAVCVVCWT